MACLFYLPSAEIDGVSCLRNSFKNYNISGHVADILMASWRSGTQKQYKTYIEQWVKFCGERKMNRHSPQIGEALDFLAGLYDKNLSYSTLNTARSALSSILHMDNCRNFGSHPLTVRFMKGVFEKKKKKKNTPPSVQQNMGCFIGPELLDHLGPNRKVDIERSDAQAPNVTPTGHRTRRTINTLA